MPTKSLLGHLALRFAVHPENLATESLAYVAHEAPAAKRALVAFVRHLGVPIPDIVSFDSQEGGADGSIPDLIGTDMHRRPVAILEAKFWAGLTDNQPVGYLRRLRNEASAMLVFVAPALRIPLLWPELLLRCREANVSLGEERNISDEIKVRAVHERHALAICSWRALLSHLLQELNLEGDTRAVADIIQLQGICDRMDDDAFLPLISEELTASIGTRFIQFCRLVDDVVNHLVADGLASVSNVRTSAGAGLYFRPMKIHGYGCYLQVNSEHWIRRRPTPVWLSIRDREWRPARVAKEALATLQLADPQRVLDGGDDMLVPIRLALGVERPAVVESVLAQVREVAALLEKVPAPPETPNKALEPTAAQRGEL